MAETIVIEKNVPLPPLDGRNNASLGGRGPKPKYPWDALEVGDSFTAKERSVIRAAFSWARSRNVRFISKQERKPPYLYRVWRVQ